MSFPPTNKRIVKMAVAAIDRITRRAERIATRKDSRIKPGQTVRFSEAASVGDAHRQGDLYLVVIESIPKGYVLVTDPTVKDRQLVPGNTQGSRHCLDSTDGVDLHRPGTWPDSGIVGPVLVLTKERTVLHPTHGSVVLGPGMYQCAFQREWDAEQKRERRNAD
jgi:hypothetical protein